MNKASRGPRRPTLAWRGPGSGWPQWGRDYPDDTAWSTGSLPGDPPAQARCPLDACEPQCFGFSFAQDFARVSTGRKRSTRGSPHAEFL